MYKNKYPNQIADAVHMIDITQFHIDNMPLFAEIPNFRVDIDKLQQHMYDVVLKYPPYVITRPDVHPSIEFGGWSVTSSTGDVYDGWQVHSGFKDGKFNHITAYKSGFRPRWLHTKKTQICTGYMNELVDTVTDMGFHPCSIRIWMSNPKKSVGMHTDGPSNRYCARLHVPIITNDDAIHTWYPEPDDVTIHMPADGRAYLFRTNINHTVHNNGDTPRYHLIFEVWYTKGVVPEFKYDTIDMVKNDADRYVNTCEEYIKKEESC